MADITETERKFLNELVMDCITYRLTEKEALEYIETRFTYFHIFIQVKKITCFK